MQVEDFEHKYMSKSEQRRAEICKNWQVVNVEITRLEMEKVQACLKYIAVGYDIQAGKETDEDTKAKLLDTKKYYEELAKKFEYKRKVSV